MAVCIYTPCTSLSCAEFRLSFTYFTTTENAFWALDATQCIISFASVLFGDQKKSTKMEKLSKVEFF